jgi:hypothetical protein
MPSPSARSASSAAPGPLLRQQRGFVTSYGVGRVCIEPGCDTALSRYNKSERCYPHADQFEARRQGR